MAKSFLDLSGLTAVIAKLYGIIASIYSSSSTYAVGSLVIYKGKLYKCSTAITTAEVWTESHWTQTTLAAEHAALNSNLSNFNSFPIPTSSQTTGSSSAFTATSNGWMIISIYLSASDGNAGIDMKLNDTDMGRIFFFSGASNTRIMMLPMFKGFTYMPFANGSGNSISISKYTV